MSPQQAHLLVGHSPDIVERMQERAWAEPEPNELTWLLSEGVEEVDALRAEIERLCTALRAVRACTDPKWQAQLISDALREVAPAETLTSRRSALNAGLGADALRETKP